MHGSIPKSLLWGASASDVFIILGNIENITTLHVPKQIRQYVTNFQSNFEIKYFLGYEDYFEVN